VATVTFEPGAAANTWDYSVALPDSAYAGAAPAAITGTLTFNASGNLTTVTPTGGVAGTVGTAPGDVQSIALAFDGLADAANGMNVQWNLLGASGTPAISQVDTASAVSATTQNGYASGQYQSFTIGSDGTVTASYSNGQQQNVGQLALANVSNLQGVTLLGDGDYATTLASGTAVMGTSGTSGLAAVQDDALEASNVNISTEFSDLIIAQRAFEANAKSVTTFDTVTQDTINMVH
jgi:flagellar hook protein FlgE